MNRLINIACFVFLLGATFCETPALVTSENLEHLALLQVSTLCYEVAIHEDLAVVASGMEGIQVVDLRNPRSPKLVGALSTVGTAVDVLIQSPEEIYVLSRNISRPDGSIHDQGLFVLSWRAGQPVRERSFVALSAGLQAESMILQYPKLDIASRDRQSTTGRLITVDVSNPDAAYAELPGFNLRYPAHAVVRSPTVAYIAGGDRGFCIDELPHPPPAILTEPNPVVSTQGYARRLLMHQGLAYVSGGAGGFWIIDPRNPNRPTALSNYKGHPLSETTDLYLLYPVVFTAELYGGIQVFDVHQPLSLERLAWIEPDDLEFAVRAVAFSRKQDLIVYVTEDGRLGIAQFPRRAPVPPPNPDLNDDGFVDWMDIFLFQRDWMKTYPTPTPLYPSPWE